MKALFELGKVVGTPGALDLLMRTEVSPASLLRRHASGDWGEVSEVAAIENALSVREGFRVLSSYLIGGEHVWIITKADRSATTILLPKEYSVVHASVGTCHPSPNYREESFSET